MTNELCQKQNMKLIFRLNILTVIERYIITGLYSVDNDQSYTENVDASNQNTQKIPIFIIIILAINL